MITKHTFLAASFSAIDVRRLSDFSSFVLVSTDVRRLESSLSVAIDVRRLVSSLSVATDERRLSAFSS